MILIGVTGKARSGKDTVAKMLIEDLELMKYSFADPMKEAARVMFGLTDEHVNGDLKETVIPELGVSPRHILQTLGTDWVRDMIRLWVVLAQRRLDAIRELGPASFCNGLIVPDVRFEDEAMFIHDNGGILIHVVRDGAPKVEAHRSENGIEFQEGDILIDNNGSLEDLHLTVSSLIEAEGLAA